MQLNKIQFRIIECSSQENDYPYIELLQQSSHSKGWQSAKFCEYPQTMVLQLSKRTRINQIQFLSHQSKICEKMMIYIDDEHKKFRKLGHVKFGDNSGSNYQLREMKSINMNVDCEFIKLELFECHVNKFNLFNQIGLIAITLFGNTHIQEQDQLQQNYKYQQLQYQLQFDKNTIKKLTELQSLLDYLVEGESYQNARVIKQTIDRVKEVGAQLRFLEERKVSAVNQQDFDSAVVIKQEIDKLKQAIIPNKVNQLLQQFQNKVQQKNNHRNDNSVDGRQEQKVRSKQEQRQRQQKQTEHQEQTYQEDESQIREEDKQLSNIQIDQKKFVDHDDVVIPAQGSKKSQKQLEREFEQKQYQLLENKKNQKQTKRKEIQKEPEVEVKRKKEVQKVVDLVDVDANQDDQKLTADQQAKVAEFIDILGNMICVKLLDKDWQIRDEQIKELQQECLKPRRTKNKVIKQVQLGCLGAVVILVNDKVVQVQISSLELLHYILQNNKLVKGSNVLTDYLIQVNEKLLHMIGDSNNRVKEVAQLCYLQLYKTGLIKQIDMFKDLVKEYSDKVLKGFKHILGRLEVLEQLAIAYKMNDNQLQQIVSICVQYLDHSNGDIRNQSMSIIQVLCRKYQYQVIKKMMGSIRQAQLDILEAEFNDQKEIQQNDNNQSQQPQKLKKQQLASKKEQVASQSQNSQLSDVNKVCEFCKKKNPNFTDEQKYDMHLWKECVMLVNCEQCDQVIEIEHYTSHLLNECKYSNQYRECGDCRLAILKNDYADHLEDNLNMEHESKFIKCQLCSREVKKDFQTHLQQEKCPNNPRTG